MMLPFAATLSLSISSNFLTYPPNTFHYCYQDNSYVSVKGLENIYYQRDSGKSSYSINLIHDSCFYINQLLKQDSQKKCTLNILSHGKNLRHQNLDYPVFQKGNCFVSTNTLKKVSYLKTKITEYLSERCDDCFRDSMLYTSTDSNQAVSDPDVSHYCFQDQHIAIQGFDGIGYKTGETSKSSYGMQEIEDSCYYSRKYFSSLVTNRCLGNETPAIYHIRNYGSCFISSNQNNGVSISNDLKNYLDMSSCRGCQDGEYTWINYTSTGYSTYPSSLNFNINLVLLFHLIIVFS